MIISPYKKPPVTPPPEHPRLMLRRKNLERISNADRNSTAWRQYRELCEFPVCGEGAMRDKGTYHLKEYLALEAKALEALLENDGEKGRDTIETLLFLLRGVVVHDDYMKARFAGHLIFLASEVYDWCYDLLTSSERDEIISRCEALAEKYLEMGYPPAKQAAISGHGNEAQLLRDLLAFSIAVYDERPDIYNFCAGRLFEEYIPAYEKVFEGEFHPQGPCYGSYRYAWAMWFGLLIYSMSGERVLPPKTVSTAESFIYLRRPDGEALRLGDDYNETKALYTHKNPFFVPLFLAAAYSGDCLWYSEAQKQFREEYLIPLAWSYDYYDEGSCGEGVISPAVYLIWDRLSPLGEERTLPSGRYFDFPVGATVYNDGERVVLMKIGCLWGANHDHLDTGCFQIYDGEILASDSGVYDSYGTLHRRKYTIHTVAHNCILVDGKGTRFPCGKKEPSTLDGWLSEYGMAKVLSHREDNGVYEIEGDLSEAYAETCVSVTRKMRFEPDSGERGILTVYDSVEPKDEKSTVAVLLHCQSEPEIDGDMVIIKGKNRELHCRVKSPANVKVEVIGGEGHRFENDGIDYLPQVDTTEAGWGRVMITSVGKTDFEVEAEIRRKDQK
ncbi:MAG: heparinase II/III family protein [Clostridia bacterium]|nr:heparinase II/III family protein [Clostridia bacterium]